MILGCLADVTPIVTNINTEKSTNCFFMFSSRDGMIIIGGVLLSEPWCFFRQLLLRAENSQPRLLAIQCTVASGSLRLECSLLRTCLTTQQSPEIQVKSAFPGCWKTINNSSLKKHQNSKQPGAHT